MPNPYYSMIQPKPRLSLSAIVVFGFMLFALLLIISPAVLRLTGVPIDYSSGDRTGVVVKISKKGVFWKTWEGEMNLGSASTNGEGVMVPTVFQFSVKDEAVVAQIQEAARKGERITLHYEEPLVMSRTEGSSGYMVTKIESE